MKLLKLFALSYLFFNINAYAQFPKEITSLNFFGRGPIGSGINCNWMLWVIFHKEERILTFQDDSHQLPFTFFSLSEKNFSNPQRVQDQEKITTTKYYFRNSTLNRLIEVKYIKDPSRNTKTNVEIMKLINSKKIQISVPIHNTTKYEICTYTQR